MGHIDRTGTYIFSENRNDLPWFSEYSDRDTSE
jgi:hypothetical protein